jgi:hypothetical protein
MVLSVLLPVFAFTGLESAVISAGEIVDRKRNLPFAVTCDHAVPEVQVTDVQCECAADADPGAEEQLDEHPVASGFRTPSLAQSREQPVLLVRVQRPRRWWCAPSPPEQPRRVRRDQPRVVQVLRETPDRGAHRVQRHRLLRSAPAGVLGRVGREEPGEQVRGQPADGDGGAGCGEPAREGPAVPAVLADRVRRAAVGLELDGELGEGLGEVHPRP